MYFAIEIKKEASSFICQGVVVSFIILKLLFYYSCTFLSPVIVKKPGPFLRLFHFLLGPQFLLLLHCWFQALKLSRFLFDWCEFSYRGCELSILINSVSGFQRHRPLFILILWKFKFLQ